MRLRLWLWNGALPLRLLLNDLRLNYCALRLRLRNGALRLWLRYALPLWLLRLRLRSGTLRLWLRSTLSWRLLWLCLRPWLGLLRRSSLRLAPVIASPSAIRLLRVKRGDAGDKHEAGGHADRTNLVHIEFPPCIAFPREAHCSSCGKLRRGPMTLHTQRPCPAHDDIPRGEADDPRSAERLV